MFYIYNNQYISVEEMNEIEEMEAAWTADLEMKAEAIKNSLANNFAFAFGPLFVVKKLEDIPSEERMELFSRIQQKLEGSCSINTYSNRLEELEANNNLPVDFTKFQDLKYNTVSYVISSDIDDSVVLIYNLNI